MTKRRRYSQEFNREALAQANQLGGSRRQVPLEIGVNPTLLACWKGELEAVSAKEFKGSGTPRDEELVRIKRGIWRPSSLDIRKIGVTNLDVEIVVF